MFFDVKEGRAINEDTLKKQIQQCYLAGFGHDLADGQIDILIGMELKNADRYLYLPDYDETVEKEVNNNAFDVQKMYGWILGNYDLMTKADDYGDDTAYAAEWTMTFKLGNGEQTGFKMQWGAEELTAVENFLGEILSSDIVTEDIE